MRRFKLGYFIVVLFLTLWLPVSSLADTPDLTKRLATIEADVDVKRKELGVPGLALAIVKGNEVIYSKGLGLRDVQHNLPVTTDTLFVIASNTKAFTAMLAEMAQDEGKLSLDDSPKRFLPYFALSNPEADADVTVRDLLAHRTGVKRTDLAWSTRVLNREEVIRVLGDVKPVYPLRQKFAYNNVTFSTAGETVAKAEGTPWEDLLLSHIFRPLEMKNSFTSLEQMQKTDNFSYGYAIEPTTKKPTRLPLQFIDFSNIAAAGAIQSNVQDMSKWLRFLINGGAVGDKRLVSERGFKEMLTPHIQSNADTAYGLGWRIKSWSGHQIIEHAGSAGKGGYRSRVAWMPDQKLGFVVLTNTALTPMIDFTMQEVWTQLLGEQGSPTSTPDDEEPDDKDNAGDAIADNDAVDSAFENLSGVYESERHTTIEIVDEGGHLTANLSNGQSYKLIETKKDMFALAKLSDKFRLEVKRDQNGVVAGLQLYQPRGDVFYKPTQQFVSPFSVDELMQKSIVAAGGAANLSRHTSLQADVQINFENEGVRGTGTMRMKTPNYRAVDLQLFALGKTIGAVHEYFNGSNGGEQTSWQLPVIKTSPQLDSYRTAFDFQQLLNWKTLFKTVRIVGTVKVGQEPALQVVKVPAKGAVIVDYISAKTFLLLKRETVTGWLSGREYFYNYRSVDGIMVPFRTMIFSPRRGNVVVDVKHISFDGDIDETLFRAQENAAWMKPEILIELTDHNLLLNRYF